MQVFRILPVGFAVLALVLSGCSSGGGAAQPTTSSAAPTVPAKPAASAVVPSTSPVAAASAVAAGAKPTVRVGSTNFTEQLILAEVYAQVLEANGYRVERRLNLGNREIVEPALESGQIDLYAEYMATMLAFVTKAAEKGSTDPKATQTSLQAALKPKGVTVLDYAQAVDTNGFVVTKATADKYHLAKMSDLTAVASQLVLGGPPECPNRPFCLPGLEQTYGLHFKDFKPLDAGGPLTVAALDSGQVDVGLLFTSSAVIGARGFVLLEDDKHLQLADNVAPVVRDELLNAAGPDFRTQVNGVTARLTTQELTDLNKQVEIERKDPKDAASAWLKAKGLVK